MCPWPVMSGSSAAAVFPACLAQRWGRSSGVRLCFHLDPTRSLIIKTKGQVHVHGVKSQVGEGEGRPPPASPPV